ncbi:MAG: ribonucleoside triphosphate reductase, partial [Lachnospiraceae bacterium]|nr:ribonucleoside triphosphate reductase [Candidatus Minthocola equi]
QYPIPTYSITSSFDWSDTENNRLLFEMTAKYGTPYFSNYINSDMEPSDVRSMCCRLRLDLRELRRKSGGFFGSGESTGSIGVVTINMPRIAYLSKTPEEFYQRLDHMMDIAARSLKIKRGVITKLLDEGLYPYTKHYLGTFENHFSTIGLVGMNEVGLNAAWLGKDMTDEKTQEFTKDVLNHMRERLSDYQEKYGDLYNLEATPAESTSYRLAKHDKEHYPDIKTANEGATPYYTNSSHLPVGYTSDIFDALDIQDELQTLYTSGTVFHAFLGEKLPSWESAAKLVRTIAENYKLPYYTMSPTYSVCKDHGYLSGEQFTCPQCGKPAEVYSRITGYYRPVQNWNAGKTQEYADRREYIIESSTLKRSGKPAPECKVNTQGANVTVDDKKVEAMHEMADAVPTIYTKEHCPKCKGAEQRFKLAGIDFTEVNCTQNIDLAKELQITQTPTIIDPDGTRFTGDNAATDWMKAHGR